jgi:hypothetical protein
MGSAKYYDERIRQFVDYLNTQRFEPKGPNEIPVDLRGPASESMSECFTWKILATADNPWVAPLEEKLPRRYPPAFNKLISRYRFCDLEVGPIMFFANTGEKVFYELTHRVFADKQMSPFLLRNGYWQFGQPASGDYDPICFAPAGPKDKRESRIVQLDHEEILIRDRIKITAEIAPSMEEFMERTIKGEFEVH